MHEMDSAHDSPQNSTRARRLPAAIGCALGLSAVALAVYFRDDGSRSRSVEIQSSARTEAVSLAADSKAAASGGSTASAPDPVAMARSTGPSQAPARQDADATFKYGVRIEGHNIPADAAYVLNVLEAADQIETRQVPLETSAGVCSLFIDQLKFPGDCVEGLERLAKSLNEARRPLGNVAKGTLINVPANVVFKADNYFERYDPMNLFDLKRMTNDLTLRAPYVKARQEVRSGMQRVEYAGFRLELENQAALPHEVVQRLVKSRRNIYLSRLDDESEAPEKFFASADSDEFYNRWCQRATEDNEFGYARLMGAAEDVDPPCPANGSCADVVLLDTDLHNNPEIAPALPPKYSFASDEPLGQPTLRCVSTIDENKHHGTFLAGLIASARNKTGFWGVHSSALLHPMRWSNRDAKAISDTLVKRDEQQPRKQLYVFASSWEPEPDYTIGPSLIDDGESETTSARFRPEMARAIRGGLGGLWIVAAGQREKPTDPLRVDKRLKYGPMNLGDRRNVLVVTGCADCGRDATLWSEARRGTGRGMQMVHVAAPATRIPGIVNNGQYAMAIGTSPATALVAGLASAHIARYGQRHNGPQWLKRWLQYTSTPSLGDADAPTVASGVVDARMAMLDPTRAWLDTSAGGWTELREVNILGWCMQAFTMGHTTEDGFQLLSHYPHVKVKNLFRIVKDRRSGTPPAEWFVYSRYPDFEGDENPGEVLRIGPATAAETARPLFKLESGIVRLGDIEDLLVSDLIPRTLTQCQLP